MVTSSLSLGPKIVIFNPSNIFYLGVSCSCRINQLWPSLVNLNISDELLYGVAAKLRFIRGSMLDNVDFRRGSRFRDRWCSDGQWSRNLRASIGDGLLNYDADWGFLSDRVNHLLAFARVNDLRDLNTPTFDVHTVLISEFQERVLLGDLFRGHK